MPRYKVKLSITETYEAENKDEAISQILEEPLKRHIDVEELPEDNIRVDDAEFYFDLKEFEDETQLSVIGDEKLKILSLMKELISKTEDAIKYQETQEEETNFTRLSSCVSDMVELITLENNDASDEEIMAVIKRINIGVSKLKSHADIEKYAQDYNEVNGLDVLDEYEKDDESSTNDNDDSDDEFDF